MPVSSELLFPRRSFLTSNADFFHLFRGRVLGGSSSVNGMQWTRGTTEQYDSWEALGNKGWNAKSLFSYVSNPFILYVLTPHGLECRYMQKSEHFNAPDAYQSSLGATSTPSAHGTNGLVSVSYPRPYTATYAFGSYITSLIKYFSPTKLAQNPDLCSGNPHGAARFIYSLIPGASKDVPGQNRRCSSAVAYVYPFLNSSGKSNKDSLTILTGTLATGIVWANGSDSKGLQVASGVSFTAAPAVGSITLGPIYQAGASKEVIVAAGALGSPHFLELSGIGDPA